MLIAVIIALFGVIALLVIYFIEKNKNDRRFGELKYTIDSNNIEINNKIEASTREITDAADGKIENVNSTITNIDFELRRTIEESDNKFNDALLDVSEHAIEYSKSTNAELQNHVDDQIHEIKGRIEFIQSDSKKYADERIQISNDEIFDKLDGLAVVLQKVLDENAALKKRLEFFVEMREDAMEMNEDDDTEEQEKLIQKAIEGLRKTRNSNVDESINNNEMANRDNDLLDVSIGADENKIIEEEDTVVSSIDGLEILDEEQLEAFKLMNDLSKNMFITGKAGTGKSFLLKVFERFTEKTLIKLAPTGIAAVNVEGATLHSTFGYDNLERLQVDEISKNTIRLKSEKRIALKEVDVIVIDEISMVRADVFDKIDKILRVINSNEEPFGGKQIIVFGDLFQLPPIVRGQMREFLIDKYGGVYFFQADAYEDGEFQLIELSTNHRQKDDRNYFDILNRIREGKISSDDVKTLNTRRINDESEIRRTLTLFPTKAEAEAVNRKELEKIQEKEYSYPVKVIFNAKGDQTRNLDSAFPITGLLKLRLGAMVMMVANDPEKRWINGTLGVVTFLSSDSIKVNIKGQDFEVKPVQFNEQEIVYINGKIKYRDILTVEQYPVVLAYAITIHKSQGMTYPKIACDISSCFATGQAYVALSRCTCLDGLYLLDDVTEQSIGVEEEVRDFYLMQTNSVLNI